MAKGVPILGKDPLGKAKYANVTESGDLRVQLSGTRVPLLGKRENLVVEPGEMAIALDISVTTPFIFVCVEVNISSKSWAVNIQDWFAENTNNRTALEADVLKSSRERYLTSDWIEAKGNLARIRVKNTSDATLTFKVHVFGVR